MYTWNGASEFHRATLRCSDFNLPGSAYAFLEHGDGFLQPLHSGFFLFGFGNPAAVFFAMRVTQFFEDWKQAFFLHQVFKLSRHFEGSYLFIFPNNDFDGIARVFAGLLAYRFQNPQRMKGMTVLDQ